MSKQRDFSVLWDDLHHYGSYLPVPVIGAAVLALIGAGVILALPADPGNQPPVATAAASTPDTDTALDDSLCAKQAWPYIDQRCAQRVEKARDTRQVRIVTDKGTSVNVVTPVPIVEAKPKPAPAAPVVAQIDRQIGPPVAPSAPAGEPAPQTEKVAVAPQPAPAPQAAPAPAPKMQTAAPPVSTPPAAANAMAMESAAPPTARSVSVIGSTVTIGPSGASAAPMSAGAQAADEVRPKQSRSARAAERAEKREAKREARRQKAIEREMRRDGVPDDVVAAAKAAPSEGRGTRRARNAVPDEVISAVKEATLDRGRGRQMVTVESPSAGGRRIYLVPRDW